MLIIVNTGIYDKGVLVTDKRIIYKRYKSQNLHVDSFVIFILFINLLIGKPVHERYDLATLFKSFIYLLYFIK